MKISELNTQSFLGGTNVPANSYVLINYADSANGTPVTKKVSVQELGKAIANDQQLYKKTVNGAVTTTVSNNAYVNGTAEKLVTSAEKEIIADLSMHIDADSCPRLTLRGNNGNSEVLVNKAYTDTNGAYALPVFYNNNTETLKYVNADNSFVNINVGGGSEFDPTVYVSQAASTMITFKQIDGNVLYDNEGNPFYPELLTDPEAHPLFISESDGEYFPCTYSAGDQTLVDVSQDVFFDPQTYAITSGSVATLVFAQPETGMVYCHDADGYEQIIDNVFNPATFVDGSGGAVVLYDSAEHGLYAYDSDGVAFDVEAFDPTAYIDSDNSNSVLVFARPTGDLFCYDSQGNEVILDVTAGIAGTPCHYYVNEPYSFVITNHTNLYTVAGSDPPAPIQNIAYIGESNSRPAIYDYEGSFVGFLSTT